MGPCKGWSQATLFWIVLVMFLVYTYALAQVDRSWLFSENVSREKVTEALTAISAPYATSAFRLRLYENFQRSNEEREFLYETIAKEPEAEGWFLLSGQWTFTTTRRAAWQSLMDLRADRLSFRLFAFLRSKSTFPTPYAYLFVLLALAIGIKILALSLHFRMAKFLVQLRRLRPQIASIQSTYSGDLMMMQQRLTELYQTHGVNFWGGCAVVALDLIFVIWALVALNDFSPQMHLDGAKFWWISDVVKYDFRILIIWVVIGLILNLMNLLMPA